MVHAELRVHKIFLFMRSCGASILYTYLEVFRRLVLSAADVLGYRYTMDNGIEFVDLVSRKECKSYINHDGYTIL